jgi:PAS domain S-box-containing protein
MLLLYGPGFVFLSLYQSHYYNHVIEHFPFFGWINFHNKNIIDIIQIYWITVLALVSLVLLFAYTFSIKNDKLLKKQSYFITIGMAIPIVTGVATEVIIPTLFHRPAIPLTSTSMSLLSLATVLALKNYKLFKISELVNNETLIESLPIILFSVSKEMRITHVNKTGIEALGLPKKNVSALSMDQLFAHASKEDEEKFKEAFRNTLKYRRIENVESALRTQHGKIDVVLSAAPIINNNKVQGILFTARDITELKKTHELIKKKEEMLEEAQQISHTGSWEWNVVTGAIVWSDEQYRLYGYEPGEALPSEIFVKHVPGKYKEEIQKIIERASIEPQPFVFFHNIFTKHGTEVTVHTQGKVSVDENNNVVRMSGTTQDITELKQKEAMLQKQNEELQKINTELDKFVYSVSHDLRAPLTSMLGIIEIMQEETEDSFITEHLNLLKTSTFKLDQFILDILDYSKNARQEIKKDEINFCNLLNEVIENLRYINNNAHKVDIRVHAKNGTVFFSDKSRVSIILNNLISNAIRYSNPNCSDPFVEIKAAVTNSHADIIVADNGIGIDNSLHDKIFEMFYRVSESSKGSGLGLYIVKEALKKLDGKITVESEKGKGSAFKISLPNT